MLNSVACGWHFCSRWCFIMCTCGIFSIHGVLKVLKERIENLPLSEMQSCMHACRTCAFLLIDLHYREKTLHLSWGGGVNFCVTFNTVFPDFFFDNAKNVIFNIIQQLAKNWPYLNQLTREQDALHIYSIYIFFPSVTLGSVDLFSIENTFTVL